MKNSLNTGNPKTKEFFEIPFGSFPRIRTGLHAGLEMCNCANGGSWMFNGLGYRASTYPYMRCNTTPGICQSASPWDTRH